jgi:hypothetical protein
MVLQQKNGPCPSYLLLSLQPAACDLHPKSQGRQAYLARTWLVGNWLPLSEAARSTPAHPLSQDASADNESGQE